MFKGLFGVVSFSISVTYILGFILDSAFLEQFGFAHFELIGASLDYLAIGGIYLMFNFAKHLFVIGVLSAIIGIIYSPLKKKITPKMINWFVDVESLPYVLLGTLPLFFVVFVPVVNDAQELANKLKNSKATQEVCVKDSTTCYVGNVLRYRSSKVVFLSKSAESMNHAFVIPEKQIAYVKNL